MTLKSPETGFILRVTVNFKSSRTKVIITTIDKNFKKIQTPNCHFSWLREIKGRSSRDKWRKGRETGSKLISNLAAHRIVKYCKNGKNWTMFSETMSVLNARLYKNHIQSLFPQQRFWRCYRKFQKIWKTKNF